MKKNILILNIIVLALLFNQGINYAQKVTENARYMKATYERLRNSDMISYFNGNNDSTTLEAFNNSTFETDILKTNTKLLGVTFNEAGGGNKIAGTKDNINQENLYNVLGPAVFFGLQNDFDPGTSLEDLNELLNKILNEEELVYKRKQWIIDDKKTIIQIANNLEKNNRLRLFGNIAPKNYLTIIKNIDFYILVRELDHKEGINFISFYPSYDFRFPQELRIPIFDPIYVEQFIADFKSDTTLMAKIGNSKLWTDASETVLEYRSEGSYMINLNAYSPNIRFWRNQIIYDYKPGDDITTKPLETNDLSLFGYWGNEKIPLFGWYSDEYTLGLQYSNKPSIFDEYRRSFAFDAGIVIPMKRVFDKANPKVPFYNSGYGVFLRLSTILDKQDLKDFELTLEGKFSVNDRKIETFEEKTPFNFQTLRSYANFEAKWYTPWRHLSLFAIDDIGNIEISAGATGIDIRDYAFDPLLPEVKEVNSPQKNVLKMFNTLYFAKVSLAKYNGIITYRADIGVNNGFKSKDNHSYFITNFEVMYDDFIGLNTKIGISLLKDNNILPWGKDLYVFVSPIIKFNFN